jgi:8-oxo-dGTP diphosphatase
MATVGAAGNDNEEFARPRVASGVLYFDGAGRVMLVKPTYKALWDIPGGYIQPDESPEAALRREVTEGLGTSLPIVGLLAVDWAPRPVEGDKLLFVFDGRRTVPAAGRGDPRGRRRDQRIRVPRAR